MAQSTSRWCWPRTPIELASFSGRYYTAREASVDTLFRSDNLTRRRPRLDMRVHMRACFDMSKMVQIRNVPDALHRKLKARAADSGQTLSDYLLAKLQSSGRAANARRDAGQDPQPKARDAEDTCRRDP